MKARKRHRFSRRTFIRLSGLTIILSGFGIPVSIARATDIPMKKNRVILSGSSWLSGKGVDIYSNDGNYSSNDSDKNYVNIGTPTKPNNILSGFRWQCVELVNRLYLTQGWITSNWLGDGSTMYNNTPATLTKVPNGSIDNIGPGDVLCLGGGPFIGSSQYGHVGIVESVNGTSVNVRNQNLSNTSDTTLTTFTWDKTAKKINLGTGWSSFYTIGIVRAPSAISSPPTPGGLSTPAAVSRTSSTMAVFFNSNNQYLANWSWDASYGWSFQQWSDNINGQPAVVARTSDSMDVFYRTAEQKLVTRGWSSANGWSNPNVLLSSGVAGDPAVVARTSGDMQVFYRTPAGEIKSVSWNWQTGWNTNPEMHYSSNAANDPVAISRTSDSMDVFFGKDNGRLVHRGWSAAYGWITEDWAAGAGVTGKPTAIVRNSGGSMSAYYQENNGRVG